MDCDKSGAGNSQQHRYVMDADIKVEMEELDEEEGQYDTMDFLELQCTVQSNTGPIELDGTESSPNPETGNHICLHCFQDIQQPDLTDHMVESHGYRKILYRCSVCNETFKDVDNLKLHKMSCHVQIRKKPKKTLLQLMAMVTALVDESSDIHTVPCPVCSLEIDKNYIHDHIGSEHHKPESLDCEICFKTFKSNLTLKEHIKLVHLSVNETEECELCGQKFRSVKYLRNHRRNVHPTGNKEFKCEFCGKIFKSRLNVHQHKKHVHPPQDASVDCHICEKTFKSKVSLSQHLYRAHGISGKGDRKDVSISGEERIVVKKDKIVKKTVDKCEQTGQ